MAERVKKVTMEDIAVKMNVSRALVSYALADKYGVSEEMKKQILTAAVEMGYFDRSSVPKKNRKEVHVLIGAEFVNEGSFFTRIIAGIEDGVRLQKLNMNLITFREESEMNGIIGKVTGSNTYGLVIIRQVSDEMTELLAKVQIPKVFVDLISPHSSFYDYEVRSNDFGNMINLTEYLIRKGHKKILFVGDITWALSYEERYRGYLYTMNKYGLIPKAVIDSNINKKLPYNREGIRQLLKHNDCTAFICMSDGVADYVYEDIKAHGLRIPEDISVVGFDDVTKSAKLDPPLTTMHIPKFEMGKVAFDLLKDQYREGSHSKTINLNADLKERKSVCQYIES